MEIWLLAAVIAAEIALVTALLLVLPKVARRGLLFGVYIGEERWGSDEAQRIGRAWASDVLVTAGIALGLLALTAFYGASPVWLLAPVAVFLAGALGAYFRAHRPARRIVSLQTPQPPLEPPPVEEPSPAGLLPLVTAAFALVAGAAGIAYAVARYPEVPGRIPVHFDFRGIPDAWAERSLAQLLVLPAMAVLMGGFLGGAAWLTARARLGLRRDADPARPEAPQRFRVATVRFLCAIGLLSTVMLAGMGWAQVEVARGAAEGMGWMPMACAGALLAVSLGGVVYLMVRYGQGGARLEGRTASPLTDGLADDRRWAWGLFYVDRDDPAFLVEKRFGFGYTLNFGNAKAVALFVGFLVAVFALVAVAIATS